MFTQPFIRAQIKVNIKAPRHWPLCGEFTGDRWIPRTNGQLRGKCFHLMTSSWFIVRGQASYRAQGGRTVCDIAPKISLLQKKSVFIISLLLPKDCFGHIQRWCCMVLHSSDRCLSIEIQMSCPLNYTSLLGRGRRIHTCICIILYCIVLYIYHIYYNCCCQWDLSNHAPISIHTLTTPGYYLVGIGSVLCECAYFMAVPYILLLGRDLTACIA